MSVSVQQLFYHPIKSLGGISADTLNVKTFGPEKDRQLMLVNDSGKFVTQRQKPIMSQIKVCDEGEHLSLHLGDEKMSVAWPDFSKLTMAKKVKVWDDELDGQIIEGEVNDWLSAHLNQDVQLVYKHVETHRQVDLEFAQKGDETGFSDGFPFLLISQASIEFLQSKLDFPISMERFRPNIAVAGCDPFEEDSWKRIAINDIEFELVKPCSRCVIPTINLNTGEKQKEVMQVLLEYRKRGKNVYVGQNLLHRGVGQISVGNQVEVLERF